MNHFFSKHNRALRRARRRGKHHARQGVPDLNWSGGPVPYLESLHAEYSQKIVDLHLEFSRISGQSVSSNEEDQANKKTQEFELEVLGRDLSAYEEALAKLNIEKSGNENENPGGKVARLREVPILVYSLALVCLAAGEYLVTYPAVQIVLNDKDWRLYVVTASFAGLSIIVSHILGISLKGQINRHRPQPQGLVWGLALLMTGITGVIIFLSALRAGQVQGSAVTFGLSDAIFGFLLFFVIQMTFIFSAIALSYFNHSEVDTAIASARRKKKKIESRIKKITKSFLTPGVGILTPEKKTIQVDAIKKGMSKVEAEYRQVCAEYRGANIIAQSESFSNPGNGLTEPSLQLPFAKVSEVSE